MNIPLSKRYLLFFERIILSVQKARCAKRLTLHALSLQPQSRHVTKVWIQQCRRVRRTVTKEVLTRGDRDCAQTIRAALTHQCKSLLRIHLSDSLIERPPWTQGTNDGLMPIEDSMLLFNYGSPKEARWTSFLPCQSLSYLVMLWYSHCNWFARRARQMKAGQAKTLWKAEDWCWSPTFSDSFQDCFTWATQSPTQLFTPGWKAWLQQNRIGITRTVERFPASSLVV